MVQQKQLTLCVITKDEEAFFPACLNALDKVADELLVIELGAQGRAAELAGSAGADVYRPVWEDDFSKIKNFCMEHASGKWVLFMYADEFIPADQLDELKLLLQNPAAEGYLIDDENGKQRALSSPTQSLRLLRNRDNYRFRCRSFAYIPEDELYSLQRSGLRISRREEKATRWQDAEMTRLLQKDISERPQDGYVLYLTGIELLNQEKYKESAETFERARQAFGGGYLYVPHLYKCLAVCLMSLGQSAGAEEVLSVGYWLFPHYTDLLVLRAELYLQLGKKDKALQDLETCLALRKVPSACLPEPEINISVIEHTLEKIRSGQNDRCEEG